MNVIFRITFLSLTALALAVSPVSAEPVDNSNSQTSALLTLVNAAPDVKTKTKLLNLYAESLRDQALAATATPLVRDLLAASDALAQQKVIDDQQALHDAAATDALAQRQCKQSSRLQSALTGSAASFSGAFLNRSILIASLILPFLVYPQCDEVISKDVPAAPSPAQRSLVEAQTGAALLRLRAYATQSGGDK